MSFRLAIIGRPNVGKSTLFNRLAGKRLALVDDRPGVTRDRREASGRLGDLEFTIVDTAGLEEASDESMEARMRRQTDMAIDEADIILFLIDARAGITPMDHHFADMLRRKDRHVIVVANKCEGRAGRTGALEAFELGLGTPVMISAEHGEGLADLHESVAGRLEEIGMTEAESGEGGDPRDDGSLHLAIVGRPNSGKSTLINRLLGTERMLTGPEAGITRDAVAIDWMHDGQPVRLFDTAGLRRKAKVIDKLEKLSVADALRAVQFADVVVLLIDATMPLEKQDKQIADLVVEEGRAMVIAVNKWDLIDAPREALTEIRDRLQTGLTQIADVEVVALSASTGDGVAKLMPAVWRAYERWNRHISTSQLNKWLGAVIEHHPPPAVQGRRIKMRYMTQTKARPPTFLVFCNRTKGLPESYRRYLINELRFEFDLPGTPIRLNFRKGENPYAA